ncbi:maestro heat-like repeat-containing protein family member 7 isoform X2 [Cygnus olor]|uniref:maestro heat-like repeat-containing protein family member 7 isoform X2 n=1 Tax=Cygnus olor TaxID=8869 RepID=UPI001ADE883B|nr:maestro heat-like repeat-containing protein family member 7 isoform X2 [Cygnus olor]
METLQYDNTHITVKALTIFKNVISHLEKREASPIALALAERLLPLFNNVSSEVRERSMLLFKDLMESVVWWRKGAMKTTVRRALIPLFFRMSDETESVAKVSAVVLLACAKFLKWKQLEQLTQTQRAETCITGEYLLKQKSSRVDGYLQQSLPYLEDAQANLRQKAIKFIGLAVYHAGIQSEEKLNELIQALQPLEEDAHERICHLAAGTIEILRHHRQQPASQRTWLAALCCWP